MENPRNDQAIALLDEWLRDETGYDAAVWKALEMNRPLAEEIERIRKSLWLSLQYGSMPQLTRYEYLALFAEIDWLRERLRLITEAESPGDMYDLANDTLNRKESS